MPPPHKLCYYSATDYTVSQKPGHLMFPGNIRKREPIYNFFQQKIDEKAFYVQ